MNGVWTHGTRVFALVAALLVADALHAETPKELHVIDPQALGRADQTLVATLQGVVNRTEARLWLRGEGAQQRLLDELESEGVELHEATDPWELVRTFRRDLKGVVLYDSRGESLNVATTHCGLRSAIAVTEAQLERARAEGLELLFDARGVSQQETLERFGGRCSSQVIVHQPARKNYHLRDYAVATQALTFADSNRPERMRTIEAVGKLPLVYGWGEDESHFVEDASRAGGAVVPADWALNLSATQHLPADVPQPVRDEPAPPQRGERIVAFVMSDGDNVQWMTSKFATSPGFWESSERGKFKMNWEMAPVLAEVAPRILAYYGRDAAASGWKDEFIAGPSGAAYYFPQLSSRPEAWVKRTAESLPPSRMRIVSMLNRGDMSAADPLLERDEVDAVFYKDYSPYNKYRGAIRWRRGKPCISYRFLLWEQSSGAKEDLPDGVAELVAAMPAAADSDPESYALVNVHAWSFQSIGGPMAAIRQTIDLLPPNTRVVTASEFVTLLKQVAAEER